MRPLSLAIEGLTSFREPQEIDFSKLDLFVITGPTGAGKSSILDAITFALYGNVPRVNNRELRELISHGSAFMRVRLDFEVDGLHYRVARRLGKGPQQVTLEQIDTGATEELDRAGVRAVNDRLEQIVGLDFNAFTKAVLLPQGAFHEFLNGDKAERRRILIRLLDLNRYEQAGQAARRQATRLDDITREREALIESNYQDATIERLGELKKAVMAASKQHAKLEQAQQEGNEIARTATEASKTITTVAHTANQIAQARADLAQLEQDWPPLEAESSAAERAFAAAQASLADADKELELARKRLTATIKRTGDAGLLARLEAAAATFAREQEQIAKREVALEAAHNQAADLAEQLLVAESEQLKTKKAFEVKTQAREKAEGEQQLAEAIATTAERAATLAALLEQILPAQRQADALQVHAEKAREHLRHLNQEHAAVALRAGLEPGDACPVCESIVEELPQPDQDIDALLGQARASLDEAETRARKAKDACVALEAQTQTATDEQDRARAALPKKTQIPSPAEASAAVAKAKHAAAAAQQANTDAQAALEQAKEHLAHVKTEAATAKERTEGLASELKGVKERLETAQATLTSAFPDGLPPDLDAAIARHRQQLSAAEEERDDATASVDTARRVRDETQEANSAIADRLSTFDNEVAVSRTAASIACEALARSLAEKVLPALPTGVVERADVLSAWQTCCDGHLAAANETMKDKEKEVAAAAKKLGRLATEAGLAVAATEPHEIEAELERAVTSARDAVVAAKKDVEAQQARLNERKKLETTIADDRQLRSLYGELARDLRGDHFIAYVLEESMNQLGDQASIELFRISDGRYSLVADRGNFDVVDHHNADERRSVATLSGGETFLASLSLALALAQGLRELAGTAGARLEATFIDEGFGALDPETLDDVVDALERLREGERMIGVITHVPTLAARIPMGLLVEKNGGSSRILAR